MSHESRVASRERAGLPALSISGECLASGRGGFSPRLCLSQVLHEADQHPADLVDLERQLLVSFRNQKFEVSRQQELILQLSKRSARDLEKPEHVSIRLPSGSLHDVGVHRNSGSPYLRREAIPLGSRELPADPVHHERERVRLIPHLELAIVSHTVSRLRSPHSRSPAPNVVNHKHAPCTEKPRGGAQFLETRDSRLVTQC